MINELEIVKFDKMFGTKSKVFQFNNTIIIETPLEEWKIIVINWGIRERELVNLKIKPHKSVCLYHKNTLGHKNQKKKYHLQGKKNNLYDAYHSIYTHKKYLPILNKINNTYNKGIIK